MTSRTELVANYKKAQAKIKELENKEYKYKINRCCDPFGRINQMDMVEIVKAAATIHDSEKTINACIDMFGITKEELNNSEARTFLGFKVEEWDEDFKLRIEELRDEKTLEKYKKAVALWSKHFSEDDKFSMDMDAIDELGVDID